MIQHLGLAGPFTRKCTLRLDRRTVSDGDMTYSGHYARVSDAEKHNKCDKPHASRRTLRRTISAVAKLKIKVSSKINRDIDNDNSSNSHNNDRNNNNHKNY